MAEAPVPIPIELRYAFKDAIGRYWDWFQGQAEPEVSLEQKPVSIGKICDLVMTYADPMPEELWRLLVQDLGDFDGLVQDRSYGSAARHLAQLIKDRREYFGGAPMSRP